MLCYSNAGVDNFNSRACNLLNQGAQEWVMRATEDKDIGTRLEQGDGFLFDNSAGTVAA